MVSDNVQFFPNRQHCFIVKDESMCRVVANFRVSDPRNSEVVEGSVEILID